MMKYILIIINLIFVIYLSTLWFMNLTGLFRLLRKLNIKDLGSFTFTVLVANIIVYITTLVILSIAISLDISLIFISFMFLHWSLWLYFNNQRFASVIDRYASVSKKAFIYIRFIVMALIFFSITLHHTLSLKWIIGVIPLWFIYGYLCAEFSIRRRMKKMSCDRKMAVFAINSDLGRNMLFGGNKYPFP